MFFIIAGSFASAITGQWSSGLFRAALAEPIALTIAVLVFGVIARILRPTLDRSLQRMIKVVAPRWIYFGLIITLGLLSSVITAVIAALILVEAVALLKLDRPGKTAAVVLARFAIRMEPAVTPGVSP